MFQFLINCNQPLARLQGPGGEQLARPARKDTLGARNSLEDLTAKIRRFGVFLGNMPPTLIRQPDRNAVSGSDRVDQDEPPPWSRVNKRKASTRPVLHSVGGFQNIKFEISDTRETGQKSKRAGTRPAPTKRQQLPIDNRQSAIVHELIPATTDSPTHFRAQYHGPWRA